MMASKKKGGRLSNCKSIHQMVLDFILSRPKSTNAEVLAAVGPHISAARAVGPGRNRMKRRGHSRWPTSKLVATGRQDLVTDAITHHHKMGKVTHLGKCLWGPPKPDLKLFNPAESA